MKKIISLIAAVSMLAVSGAAMAADNEPKVFVNTAEIMFDDQPAVIVDGRTLVPARGVFEAMGATVDWDGEKRQVEVTSSDNKTLVRLTIDNAEMKVYDISGLMSALLAGQEFHAPETDVTLDVPAQIMSDRTMVPLRAISEALDADVQWDGQAYKVDITTTDVPTDKSSYPGFTLTADATEVNEGEDVELYVNLNNLREGMYVANVSVGVEYNPDSFEFVKADFVNGDTVIEDAIGASNAEFAEGLLKTGYVTINAETAAQTDGKVVKLTFKSKTGKEGTFRLSSGYHTRLGYHTSLTIENIETEEANNTLRFRGDDLNVDTTPLVINAGK